MLGLLGFCAYFKFSKFAPSTQRLSLCKQHPETIHHLSETPENPQAKRLKH